MGLVEYALLITLAVVLYNLQQLKMILKEKGYPVDMFTGWLQDYRQLKDLCQQARDEDERLKYQKILNGLHFSIAGLIFCIVLLLRDRL